MKRIFLFLVLLNIPACVTNSEKKNCGFHETYDPFIEGGIKVVYSCDNDAKIMYNTIQR